MLDLLIFCRGPDMATKLTKRYLESLKPDPNREIIVWDKRIPGFGFRITPKGARSFFLKYRTKAGQQRKPTIGVYGDVTLDEARDIAEDWRKIIRKGGDPSADKKARRSGTSDDLTVGQVAENFIARHAKAKRSGGETERIFNKYVLPRWRNRSIYSITRRDVAELLDRIVDDNGPVMADRVLAAVRKCFNWQATRDDKLVPPFVRGMARTNPKERARDRVLSDTEIRALWAVADQAHHVLGPLARFLLLSGQRREEASTLRWTDIDAEGVWAIDKEDYKTKVPHWVPLSEPALEIVQSRPKPEKAVYVFSTTGGRRPFQGFSKAKRKLDTEMLAKLREWAKAAGDDPKTVTLPGWTLHDLRRTADTLMRRAGVPADHVERVLGHKLPGVRAIYDRHNYLNEKRHALEKLAAMVDGIVNPVPEKVVRLTKAV
jgi:integrase